MKKIKISFEYHCYPIWVYDENGFLLSNDLPEPLQNNKGLAELCQSLQSQFDSLYRDDGKVFEYVGFENEEQYRRFQEQAAALRELLETAWGEAVSWV